ncbi:MAG TPA: 4Fe-4S dicluster domain-containing protein [Syntrophales bacterium]|nr:4Fe-4S dicluster domain-containing protein [Syntrophales bacterium]HPX11490.1 4Fe-4S dicluster domain-containing protein [Syntrophales bacterium]HQB30737.1 4Fe-4S dicluster domain-containing protein [Syntrophales bacterium]HQN77754.1 4Fe-4S dicluster domain-containing protein [Syntrophales bacterium]HQQ27057.1 4Fe-4S dicluster domain-containing protein [Syntrophales bacterium]
MERDDHKFPDVLSKETTRRGFLKGAAAVAGGAVALATVGGAASPKKAMAQAPKDVMRYLFAERQNCTGCRACEYACSVYHTGVVRPSVARVHVLKYRGVVDVPVICWHCDDAPCIEACPTTPKAIQKDKASNGIILDEKICLGAKCLKCKEACPAQFIRVNPDKGMPLMCDLCGGDPECVKACYAQSGNPQGPCLMANKLGFGVNQAYRDVTPEEAGEDLYDLLFFPSKSGGRR